MAEENWKALSSLAMVFFVEAVNISETRSIEIVLFACQKYRPGGNALRRFGVYYETNDTQLQNSDFSSYLFVFVVMCFRTAGLLSIWHQGMDMQACAVN